MEPTERVGCAAICVTIIWPVLTHTDSGLLTGKYKRGESPSSDSNSRLAWVEKDKATRANQASPSLSDYADNEQYWELIEAMKTIATVHGECSSL